MANRSLGKGYGVPVQYVLTASCQDGTGIVAAVTTLLAAQGCFIDRTRSFGDPDTGRFFLRIEFHPTVAGFSIEEFVRRFGEVGERFGMDWRCLPKDRKLKTLILVSKFDHCANALLYAARVGELPIEPVAILSNHADLQGPLAHWNTPFHVAPVTLETKPQAEARMFDLIEQTGAELVVLARYMQVLSEEASERLAGACINIHHSFLPSFKGAKPYHQAHARGVKIIGASAHYVTSDLDEGPIIAQAIEPVDHNFSVQDLVVLGRHLESAALVRAVKAHAERRVFINGRKTVVLA
ncbi:MAG: formyltetrahydrofolate deformylase [Caulobacterales bacterium]|nr:formyltetrahydrofolate deformylase [Caulobacterales bacterium]